MQTHLATADSTLRTYADLMNWHLHFLGVGAAHAVALGSSAAVLERDGVPMLLIDCGADTLDRYMATYDALPPLAVFISRTRTWTT